MSSFTLKFTIIDLKLKINKDKQGHKIRKSESKKAMQPGHSIKVVLCDLKSYFILRQKHETFSELKIRVTLCDLQ